MKYQEIMPFEKEGNLQAISSHLVIFRESLKMIAVYNLPLLFQEIFES